MIVLLSIYVREKKKSGLKIGRRQRKNEIFTDFHEGVYIRNRRKKIGAN
jgi:hypothetical protein